ncbi:MAG: OmpA family protein [Halocynthiibacter sp.]
MTYKLPTALLLSSSLLAAGCMTVPQNNSDDPNARAKSGALIGAAIGGVIGATRKGDNKLGKTAVGAAVGAAAGALVGTALDAQARDLEENLDNKDVKIENTGSELIVTMPQDLLFDVDSAKLSPALRDDLNTLAANLGKYPDSTIDVIGHTDNTGSAEHNQALSTERAHSVAYTLMDAGVAPARVRAIGRGEDEPVASNLSEEGKRQNRRVNIIIRPTR